MIILRFVVNLGVFLIPAALVAVACRSLSRSSREEWRLLAWVPLLPLGTWGPYVAWGVTRDPTSHNLWPFEMVFWAAVSLALLIVFLVGRRLFRRSEPSWAARRNDDRS